MENNGKNEVAEEENQDDGSVITLEEFIEEETRLETDAQAVLGPLDDKTCTYSQGYMGRQALYACKTCKGNSQQSAAVCLACSYHCHEGHDLIELYTKRNFRCDCGNSRFKDNKCNLEPIKETENCNNRYNDNFEGLYCTCKRPYPDPEDSVPDEMIQCIVCEDWYHTRHLNADLPGEENYAEMICSTCTASLPFLKKYLGYAVTKVVKDERQQVDVTSHGGNVAQSNQSTSANPCNRESTHHTGDSAVCSSDSTQNGGDTALCNDDNPQPGGDVSRLISNTDSESQQNDDKVVSHREKSEEKNGVVRQCESSVSSDNNLQPHSNVKGCLLESLKEVEREKDGATFWPHNFRSLLCTCLSCKEMYARLKVSYLTDVSDTVQSYEDKGTSKLSAAGSSADKHSLNGVLSILNKMGVDRFSQAEAILNYNDLKTNLTTYLSKFAENKKVVREEDIHEFFTQMKARKRQRTDQGHNFSCR